MYNKSFLREGQLFADFRFSLESEPNLREKRGIKKKSNVHPKAGHEGPDGECRSLFFL